MRILELENSLTRMSQNPLIHSEDEENKSEIKDFPEADPKKSEPEETNKGI